MECGPRAFKYRVDPPRIEPGSTRTKTSMLPTRRATVISDYKGSLKLTWSKVLTFTRTYSVHYFDLPSFPSISIQFKVIWFKSAGKHERRFSLAGPQNLEHLII